MVAEAADLPERVPEVEEAADASCVGVSLLEYMDAIACEDLSDSGEAAPAAATARPPCARWPPRDGDRRDGTAAAPPAGAPPRTTLLAPGCARTQ